MTTYTIVHRTSYRYSRSMVDGFSLGVLLPRPTDQQLVRDAVVHVDPQPDEYEESFDRFGNRVFRFGVHRSHQSLVVEARSTVDVEPPSASPATCTFSEAVAATASARGALARELDPFLGASAFVTPIAGIDELVEPLVDPSAPAVDVVGRWCSAIFGGFRFDPHVTDVSTPLADVLAARQGVCQDFAHVAIAGLRHVGLAARYVSGYLETSPPPGQPRLVGADASHAWCSVWLPGAGWVDLDPTNDQFPPQRHITVAWGRDYADVAPLRGVVIGPPGTQDLEVSVDVLAS